MNLGSGTICQNGCAVRPKGTSETNKRTNERQTRMNKLIKMCVAAAMGATVAASFCSVLNANRPE